MHEQRRVNQRIFFSFSRPKSDFSFHVQPIEQHQAQRDQFDFSHGAHANSYMLFQLKMTFNWMFVYVYYFSVLSCLRHKTHRMPIDHVVVKEPFFHAVSPLACDDVIINHVAISNWNSTHDKSNGALAVETVCRLSTHV